MSEVSLPPVVQSKTRPPAHTAAHSLPLLSQTLRHHGRRVHRHHAVLPRQAPAVGLRAAHREAARRSLLGALGADAGSWAGELHKYSHPCELYSHVFSLTMSRNGEPVQPEDGDRADGVEDAGHSGDPGYVYRRDVRHPPSDRADEQQGAVTVRPCDLIWSRERMASRSGG
jgi:hypothetical protein